ncbi:hypothetical protein EYZ11_006933 [Aspergillus tanneri]|uniref:Uncharacterized protein n=1 Tax=Aspergillus tanneri TaxID=1220188 RepID=A0A4S3JEJ1_9EURO|nr:hypothetical protein EYZ11_006933 [Aspergillus tanneri]
MEGQHLDPEIEQLFQDFDNLPPQSSLYDISVDPTFFTAGDPSYLTSFPSLPSLEEDSSSTPAGNGEIMHCEKEHQEMRREIESLRNEIESWKRFLTHDNRSTGVLQDVLTMTLVL